MSRVDNKRRSSERGPKEYSSENKKIKNGRKQMRTVERTARRPPKNSEDTHEEEEQESSEDELPQQSADVESDSDDETNSSKAYDALLTLLKYDNKKGGKKQSEPEFQKEDALEEDDEDDEDDEDEEDEDEIAGANVQDDDEEDEDEVEAEEDDSDDEKDPFEQHFNNADEEYLDREAANKSVKWTSSRKTVSATDYSLIVQTPEQPLTSLRATQSIDSYPLKQRVVNPFKEHKFEESLNDSEKFLIDPLFQYQDVSYPYVQYNNQAYRTLYALHILNHVFKTRDRILKNNNKLHSVNEMIKNGTIKPEEEPEFRDQGFTRPKVLILLPTRNSAYKLVEILIKLSGSEQQENFKKFKSQFHDNSEVPDNKPDDFKYKFNGNSNDFFCLGIKFTRKTIKLYSSFYTSDIIIASPIGLSMILESPDKKKRSSDFLSSIEILCVDETNSLEMQNWDHINTIYKYLNHIPKESHDADFSRIRMWSINDQAKYLRQTLVFSEYLTPNVNSLINKSVNLSGKYKFKPIITAKSSAMNKNIIRVKQIFNRFDCSSPIEEPDTRFKFFINSVLTSILKTTSYDDGLLVYIPSYIDYIRVKNYLNDKTSVNFGAIDEYSTQAEYTRVRAQFQQSKIKVLLYTERLHHFRRFDIRGVKNIIFYQLPSNPLYYNEVLKFFNSSIYRQTVDIDLSLIRVMFNKLDFNSLERIVGNERIGVLCNGENEIFEFR